MSRAALAAALLLLGGCDAPVERPARVEARGETFVVGDAQRIAGTRFVAVDVTRGEMSQGAFLSSSSARDLRNVLLLDVDSGQSRRLLPGNKRRIRAVHWLSPDDRGEMQPASGARPIAALPSRWYALEVERPGGVLVDVLAGRIDADRAATIATRVDGVDFLAMRDPTHAALIARSGGKLSYRVIDMDRLRPVSARGIAL